MWRLSSAGWRGVRRSGREGEGGGQSITVSTWRERERGEGRANATTAPRLRAVVVAGVVAIVAVLVVHCAVAAVAACACVLHVRTYTHIVVVASSKMGGQGEKEGERIVLRIEVRGSRRMNPRDNKKGTQVQLVAPSLLPPLSKLSKPRPWPLVV